jgi:hypothetical protein
MAVTSTDREVRVTIAIAVKVSDGIVLASDSATTVGAFDPTSRKFLVHNIYNHGTKIFRLHRDLALGAITWGLGNIGMSSLKILAKDFRAELMSGSIPFDSQDYTVEQVANHFKNFVYDRHYEPLYGQSPDKPAMGFKIAGYGSNQAGGEVWHLQFGSRGCEGPKLDIPADLPGLAAEGTPTPVRRLVLGLDPEEVEPVLARIGLSPDQVAGIIEKLRTTLFRQMVHPSMPIQDAIDLAVFLAQTTAQFTRFAPGPDTVGGPVEVAALTRYEGFKWVERKHYFQRRLNP